MINSMRYYKRRHQVFFGNLWVVILILLLFLVIDTKSVDLAWATTVNYQTGALPFTSEIKKLLDKNSIFVNKRRTSTKSLPAQVKNWRYLPVVRNQQLADCGAFSPSYYYKTYQEAREHGWLHPDPEVDPEHVMSPGFTYPLNNGGKDTGASVYGVLEGICRYGIAPWSVMPETNDYLSWPKEAAWRAAIPYRGHHVVTFDTKTLTGLDALKEHLAAGDPAVMTALLYHDTFDKYGSQNVVGADSDVIYGAGTKLWDWHAFTIIGYDDNKHYTVNGKAKKGAFLAVNSWGPGWGVYDADVGSGGFVWFAYDYMLEPPGGSMAGPVMALEDRIDYNPTDLAVFDVSIGQRSTLRMGLCVGSPDNYLSNSIDVFPHGGGSHPFEGRVVVDVSDLGFSNQLVCYDLGIRDISTISGIVSGRVTGSVTHFQVEKSGGLQIGSPVSSNNPCIISAGGVYGLPMHVFAGPLNSGDIGIEDLNTESLIISPCDWDNDGLPDLGVGGGALPDSAMLRFYRNTGNSGFSRLIDLSPSSVSLSSCELAWGDYDNDGYADLAVAAHHSNDGFTRIYHNRDVAGFSDSGIALPILTFASLAWGDYNNDGRLDLVIAGKNAQGQACTRIYRNEGEGRLVDSDILLDQKFRVGVSWADMDNDGWLDLAVGATLYQNNTDGTFTKCLTIEDGVDNRQAWGDFDGDGLLDLAYMGYDDSWDGVGQPFHSSIYRNQGGFKFADINAGIHDVYAGTLAWADFDNDGLLDLAICGYDAQGYNDKSTRVFHQAPKGHFQDIGADLPPVAGGTVAWVDMDRDGALDLFVSGHGPTPQGSSTFQGATAFLYSRVALPTELDRPNQPPSVPDGLRVDWNDKSRTLTLLWNPASDKETASSLSLGYRLRVGTWSGGNDIISSASRPNLYGSHPHCHLVGGQPGRYLANLPAGRYYWSVQAIDGGMASSEWSPEKTFVIGPKGLLSGDVNGDGLIDVADIVRLTKMVNGQVEAPLAVADLDGNGKVQFLDVKELLDHLLDRGSGAYMQVHEDTLVAGGTVTSNKYGIELAAPQGSLSAPKKVSFAVSSSDQSYGPGTEPISWQVRGMPIDNTAPLKLRVRDLRKDTSSPPFLAIGTNCFSKCLGKTAMAYRTVRGHSLGNGWVEIELPEPGALTEQELQSINGELTTNNDSNKRMAGNSTLVDNYDFWFVIHILATSQWRYKGGNFIVTGPLDKKGELPLLAADLEEALTYYRDTLGFNVKRRNWAKYPVEVTAHDVGGKLAGDGFTSAGMGYNSISIEINQCILSERERTRVTAVHELFHVMQYLMDTRNRIARKFLSPDLWLDEATATYMESHFAHDPDFIGDLLKANKMLSFNGYWQAEKILGKTSQDYGYGSAPLIQHLVNLNGGNPDIIRKIYEKIQAGSKGLHALTDCAPGHPLCYWYSGYFREIVSRTLYPGLIEYSDLRNFATSKRIVTLAGSSARSAHFPKADLYPFSAGLSFIQFDKTFVAPDAGSRLGFLLRSEKPSDFHMEILSLLRNGGNFTVKSLGYAKTTESKNGQRIVIPDAAQYTKANIWLVPVVTDKSYYMPYDKAVSSTLHFGIIKDYDDQKIIEHNSGAVTVYTTEQINLHWPVFTAKGVFSAHDVTQLVEGYKTSSEPSIPGLSLNLWGDPVQAIDISYMATANTDAEGKTIFDGFIGSYQVTATYLGNQRFRLRKWHFLRVGNLTLSDCELVDESSWQDTADFTLTMDDDEGVCLYAIEMKYDYHLREVYGDGQIVWDADATKKGEVFSVFTFRD